MPAKKPLVLGSAAALAAAAVLTLALRSGAADAAQTGAQGQPAAGAARAASPELPAVTLVSARSTQAAPVEEVTGSLEPAQGLRLGFEVGGRVAEIKARKGQRVKKGDVLGRLDPEIANAQVAQAEAAVAAAEAQATLARDVARRNKQIQEGGSLAEVQAVQSEAQSKAADAQAAAARATLAQARAARSRHDLRAPFDGTVVDAPEQVGATVGPGLPLFALENLDTLLLKTTVAEAARARIQKGGRVTVAAVGSGARTADATVRDVVHSADATTRRIPVDVLVPNKDGQFVAHTLARAQLPLGEAGAARVVPASALLSREGDFVFVLDGAALKKVPVQVLERRATEVVVRAEAALDKVVDRPSSALADGTRVSVK